MPSVGDVKVKVVAFVLTLVMLIIVLNLTPIFIDSAQIDTSLWNDPATKRTSGQVNNTLINFTGAAAAQTLIGLLPLIVVIVIFVAIAVSLFQDLI